MATFPPSTLAELLRSGDYSDLKITCRGRVFNVHRIVVCQMSGHFRSLCGKVPSGTSLTTAEILEIDPDVLASAFEFIYTGSYSDKDATTTGRLSKTDICVAGMTQEQMNQINFVCPLMTSLDLPDGSETEKAQHTLRLVHDMTTQLRHHDRVWSLAINLKCDKLKQYADSKWHDSHAFSRAYDREDPHDMWKLVSKKLQAAIDAFDPQTHDGNLDVARGAFMLRHGTTHFGADKAKTKVPEGEYETESPDRKESQASQEGQTQTASELEPAVQNLTNKMHTVLHVEKKA